MKSTTLKIEGMACDGCAHTLKTILQRQPGVKTATVDFKLGEARVLYDPSAIEEDRLIATVKDTGYRVTSSAP